MKQYLLPTIALLCIGCTSSKQDVNTIVSIPRSSVSSQQSSFSSSSTKLTLVAEPRVIEQVPSELSIEHFSKMKLEGSDLQLVKVLADNTFYTRHQIQYNSNGLIISGIMNIPKGDGPFPLIIFNHGYIDPAIYTVGRGLKREQDYLAKQGFAVLHTDYRGHGLSDKSPDEKQVYDASLEYSMDSVNAIKAVKKANLPTVSTSKVGMLGHSMGGGVTLNIATAFPDLVDAIVLYAPVHSDAWENFTRWRDMRDEGDRTRKYFGSREENPENWDKISSLSYLHKINDPVLLFHGTNDQDVPLEWSTFLDEELTKIGKQSRYVVYQNEKHEFIPKWNDFMKQTTEFFTENL